MDSGEDECLDPRRISDARISGRWRGGKEGGWEGGRKMATRQHGNTCMFLIAILEYFIEAFGHLNRIIYMHEYCDLNEI